MFSNSEKVFGYFVSFRVKSDGPGISPRQCVKNVKIRNITTAF